MKTARTPEEIAAEIEALENAKAWAPRRSMFGENNHDNINLQIEYLRGEIDTADDDTMDEFSDSARDAISEAENWAQGDVDEKPSAGWDAFKK